MSRDRSLDEFLGESRPEDGSGATADVGTVGNPSAGEPDSTVGTQADPDDPFRTDADLEIVYGWSDGPGSCDDCGTAVSRRWYDGGTPRCEECKEW